MPGSASVEQGRFVFPVPESRTDENDWHVQLQHELIIEDGQAYIGCFEAQAAAPRSIKVNVDQGEQPWASVSNQGVVSVGIDTINQRYEYRFTGTANDNNARFTINLAGEAVNVSFDNIAVYKGSTCPDGPPPSSSSSSSSSGALSPSLSLENCRFANEGGKPQAIAQQNYQSLQGYLEPANQFGIDALYAWTVPGGTGKNVTVADIEYATWNLDHEDLSGTRICFAENGSRPFDFSDDHGSGVIGVLVADNNGFGVTGIVHDASLLVINHANVLQSYTNAIASAIDTAVARLEPGDVVLIEANIDNQNGLAEQARAVYDAIVRAVNAGLIVVATAGNGGVDLDQVQLFGDSGAIIAGGGSSARSQTPLAPIGLNFGSRVDLQGWGRDVATIGRGTLNGNFSGSCNNLGEGERRSVPEAPPCSDMSYRRGFSGTSSAGPIVAGAAAVISSVAQERGYLLTSRDVRRILKDTGTPQAANVRPEQNIGKLPNLKAAIESMPLSAN